MVTVCVEPDEGSLVSDPAVQRRAFCRRLLRHASAALVLSLGVFASTVSAQTVVRDGEFATWVEELAFFDGVWSRPTTGGQPDAHLVLSGSSPFSSVVLRQDSTAWDPATQGPLATIRFAADVIGTSGGMSTGQPVFGFVLLQGGEIYLAATTFDAGDWIALDTLDLSAADFVNTLNPGLQPDFSPAGSAIQLGLVGSSNLAASFDFQVDNFEATLTAGAAPVPTLGAVGKLTLLLGLIAHPLLIAGPLLVAPPGRARSRRP